MSAVAQSPPPLFKLLPAYLDTDSIEEALRTHRGRRILWLETRQRSA